MGERVTMTTYRRADGELWANDSGWFVDSESVEHDLDGEQAEVVIEEWVLVGSKTVVMGDPTRFCLICDDDWEDEERVRGPHLAVCEACSSRIISLLFPQGTFGRTVLSTDPEEGP